MRADYHVRIIRVYVAQQLFTQNITGRTCWRNIGARLLAHLGKAIRAFIRELGFVSRYKIAARNSLSDIWLT